MFSLILDTPEAAHQHDEVRHEDGRQLIHAIGLSRNHKVLDIGCGTGRLGEHVARIVGPGGEVVGIDASPLRVAIAQRRCPEVFKASVGSFDALARFETGYFDVACLNSVLHWSGEQAKIVGEAWRVLRKNGRLGLSVANRSRPDQRIRILVDVLSQIDGVDLKLVPPDVPHAVAWRQVSSMINQAGFTSHTLSDEVLVDYHARLDDVLAFGLNSAFGNFLSGLEDDQHERLRQLLAERLAPLTTSKGIRLERYLIFAVANRHR